MENNQEIPEVGCEQLNAALRFLPIFTRPDYTFAEAHHPEGQFPFYSYSDEVMGFLQVLYDQGIVFSFNWPEWQDEAEHLYLDAGALEKADLLTLRKLLTTHVRKDRFCEGHLAAVLENGHIVAILQRLVDIRAQLELRPITILRRNDRDLPYLDTPLLNLIFEGVYGRDCNTVTDEAIRDFLTLLYTMQSYNYAHRPQACAALFPLVEEEVGPMEINSEGTTLWLALVLAIKELYGMRTTTLREVLQQITVRK